MSTKLKAGTATSGAVLDADTTGILELQTGSTPTTAVTINAAGYVTTPYQPAFYGFRNGGNVTGPTTALHNVVVTNIGSCYNSGTGVFTCPIAGVYEVIAGGHAENSQPIALQIRQNGTVKGSEYSNGSLYGAVTVAVILSCSANDQLSSYVITGTMWGGDESGLKMSVKLIG